MFFVLASIWARRFGRRAKETGNEVEETTRRLFENDPTLTHLTIQGEQLSEESLRKICLALRDNDAIRALTLQNMHFDKSWTKQWLVPSLRNKRLLSLTLDDCSDDNDSTLADALTECRYLQSIIIRSCDFEPSKAWGKILRGNECLTDLRICYSHSLFARAENGDRVAMTSLSEGIAGNSSLSALDLSGNGLDDESIAILSQALAVTATRTQGPIVSHLTLDFNAFGDDAASRLAQVLLASNCSLIELSLFGNRISDGGASSLARALYQNTSLTSLILSLNRMGDAGVASLARALTVNTSLHILWFPSNHFGVAGLQTWGELLPQMRGLEHLHVGMVLDQAGVDALCCGLKTNVHLKELHMELAVHEEELADQLSSCRNDVDFWLRLNRSGRRVLLRDDTGSIEPSVGSQAAPLGLCAKILSQADSYSGCVPDVLFYMLQEKPELLGAYKS